MKERNNNFFNNVLDIMYDKFRKKEKYMEKIHFEVRLVHKEPIDLIQMANSLIALNNISKSHISKEHGVKESKILLKGVKEGSDIYQLVLDFGIAALPLIDGIKSIHEVLEYIQSYKNIEEKTVSEIKDNRHYNTVDAENIKNFIAPVLSADDNSTIEVKIEGNVNAPIIIINTSDAKKIMENVDFIKRITSIKEIEEVNDKSFKKVLIKIHKAIDSVKQVKDSSYCDDIVKGKAIATIFENIEDKKDVLINAFTSLFLVDIEVVKANNEIKLYRVTKLHNIVPMDEE